PLDGGADLRLAGQMSPPERGPGEKHPFGGSHDSSGHDSFDAKPIMSEGEPSRFPLPQSGLIHPYRTDTNARTGRGSDANGFWERMAIPQSVSVSPWSGSRPGARLRGDRWDAARQLRAPDDSGFGSRSGGLFPRLRHERKTATVRQ